MEGGVTATSSEPNLESVAVAEGSDYKRFGLRRASTSGSMEEPISPSSQGY